MGPLERIRVVLVEPEGPLNVGMVARVMKNMGLKELVLVKPKAPPLHPYCLVMATGAKEVLWEARVLDSLEEALKGSALVVGTTRRRRKKRELIPLREAAPRVLEVAKSQRVSVLFGREDSGLTNEELSLCHLLVTIPADPVHGSLNLSHAVAVFLYELRSQLKGVTAPKRKLAPWEELQGLFAHMEEALSRIGFMDPQNPKRGVEDLKEILLRAGLDSKEVRLLRGLFRRIIWATEKATKGGKG